MLWDLYCEVIDNHGDLGVCWRLAADLAARGEAVRLHVDDAAALAWMAPEPRDVQVLAFADATHEPGDVVIEAFGCDPPAAFVERMQRARPPVWINLEYLSAEPYAERSHGLPSPQQAGPGAGLRKWFYYPGFAARTGGLLREPWLAGARATFERDAWFGAHAITRQRDERVVSIFCYTNPLLPQLLDALAAEPTLLLVTAGSAAEQVRACLGPTWRRGALHALPLPYLSQRDIDRLLWSCDLNFVRGEDSFVRAQWAGAPFVWQAYVQRDGAQRAKLDAFLELFLARAPAAVARQVSALCLAWNGFRRWPDAWPEPAAWRSHSERWRAHLLAQPDLATRLIAFVDARR